METLTESEAAYVSAVLGVEPRVALIITPTEYQRLWQALPMRTGGNQYLPAAPLLGTIAGRVIDRYEVIVLGCSGSHVLVNSGVFEPTRCGECGAVWRGIDWRAR